MTKEELEWATKRLQWYEDNHPEMTMAEKFRAVNQEWKVMEKEYENP